MGTWSFVAATMAMEASGAVLDLRDRVVAAADVLGLRPDGSLRAAYEGAQDSLTGATTLANDELAALAAISGARAGVEGTPDLLTQVGLVGETPRTGYDAARTAFEAGQLDEAERLAGAIATLYAAAPAVGRERLLVAAGTVLGLLLVLGAIALLVRRRRVGRGATALTTVTLAADPSAAPVPPGEAPMDVDGGHGDGDTPLADAPLDDAPHDP
jgi:hypothetical protein